MGRWTGSWLSGPASAGVGVRTQRWRGERLGLPERGPGSVPEMGARIFGFVLDIAIAGLIGGVVRAFVAQPDPSLQAVAGNVAFAVEVIVLVALTGQSFGMRIAGLRVIRVRDGRVPSVGAVVVRTALLMLLVPALIWDRDNRGLHDKATGTVVVRA